MTSSHERQKRAAAKFLAAVESMRPALQAAMQAAHELQAGMDEDERHSGRVMEVGFLALELAEMSGPCVHVLNEVPQRDDLQPRRRSGRAAQPCALERVKHAH